MNRLPERAASDRPSTRDEGAAPCALDDAALTALAARIRAWGRELGFGAIGISDTDLSDAEAGLAAWLEAGYHGEMDYMAKHGMKRARPAELVAGTRRVISVRLAYLPAQTLADGAPGGEPGALVPHDWRARERARLDDPQAAVVSIYARGRDYHKVLRNRLQTLAERIEHEIGGFGYRVFTDSAPVLEVELAQKAGVGWRGKHTLLLQRDAGSLFFLGEIYVDLPLPTDAHTAPDRAPETPGAHCGNCTRCIDACPTGAIVEPYRVDGRRCISYLTIELKGSIPEPLRPMIGNRVYGCDDCQLVCPWNKFAQAAPVADFDVRHGLDRATLVELFAWDADTFDTRMQGSAIRRIGYESWLRNLAVGLGNALRAGADRLSPAARDAIVAALRARADDPSPLVREHVEWALRAA
ncbi:tRNA epoxyqueuosine(34) reductase QueG [Burkholderia cenocepacia]|uniref:tRNA epoxyqueuosine(34) reductase QueG n=1 Tax=Burkholderia cenocepacia TaxID=95486 RepID=UPI0006650E42|nr:tRNA epoxyqueuosine(34) reductase QueG [Burkholderia cenocepacia]MCW3659301.1 tRNA epoxyqueuosine(34) reductase QueG [Burkholderia cenocepacia]MDR8049324.1 tRNA epoxyqueuosine(34) reductase QueG [Burkholderia cenocepacia]MDS0808168.1 tRNA epoxyqueuosine(34) reductase QueG [Burkholderia cenocepacia]MDV3098444.1 tRNA epoxyqueuosine(34) reductase QueG [Burkholderia cenocepacia]HDR9874757.1 tRNA epoxyqueuosine(34) reductase QueG [Burkholderia cenocepacia]